MLIDRDEDGLLSWEELYGFNIDKVMPPYADVFHPSAAAEQESAQKAGEGDAHSDPCNGERTELDGGVCKTRTEEKTSGEKKLDQSETSEHRHFDHEEL